MKNRLIQIALSVCLIGLLIQIVLIAPSQIRDHEAKTAAAVPNAEARAEAQVARDNSADQSMKGMHMIETQEGRKEWELESDRATSLKAKDIVQLEKVKTIFFANSGVTFTVTGNRGTVQVNSKNLHVEGDVVTRTSNGYVFRTQSMDYDSSARALSAANEVEMDGPHGSDNQFLHLRGIGMRASLVSSTMEILNDVHAEKGLDQNRKAYIRSKRSLFSSTDKSARFLDHVILDLESMRITGPEARFDYDNDKDLIKSVYFSGGSRVSDTDKWATAQNVNIDFADNKFTFSGDPRVVQDNDELRGEEIVFLNGGKQVQVQRARAKVDEIHMDKNADHNLEKKN